jgi:hypothetical protein
MVAADGALTPDLSQTATPTLRMAAKGRVRDAPDMPDGLDGGQ